jgi:hypothetical protein
LSRLLARSHLPGTEAGIEQNAVSGNSVSGLGKSLSSAGAESGAVGAGSGVSALPDDLAELMAAWPKLPNETRQAILAIARGCSRDGIIGTVRTTRIAGNSSQKNAINPYEK